MAGKIILRYAIREMMGLVVMGVALLWPAGRIDWWPAWAAIGVMLAWILATAVVILRLNPELLAERLGSECDSASGAHCSGRRHFAGGLGGYVDYARQVRYRLLPGVW